MKELLPLYDYMSTSLLISLTKPFKNFDLEGLVKPAFVIHNNLPYLGIQILLTNVCLFLALAFTTMILYYYYSEPSTTKLQNEIIRKMIL